MCYLFTKKFPCQWWKLIGLFLSDFSKKLHSGRMDIRLFLWQNMAGFQMGRRKLGCRGWKLSGQVSQSRSSQEPDMNVTSVIKISRNVAGGPVVKTWPSNAGVQVLLPGWRAKIPHASWPKNQNIKQKQYCNKFNKDLKTGSHQKNLLKSYLDFFSAFNMLMWL